MQFFSIANIDDIDFNKLIRQLPSNTTWNPLTTQAQYITAILQSYDVLKAKGIDNPLRLAHFLGQGIVETGFMKAKSENLNYSYESLKKMWSHKFDSDEQMKAYARKPEKIANRIYADRMGNGPEASGDGWKYRGRGFFQLTGRDNYRRFGEMAGIDLEGDPELIERDLKKSIEVAASFFQKTGLGEFADKNDVAAVSRGVNRGNPRASKPAYHEAERIQWTTKALALVKDPNSILGGAGVPPGGGVAPGDSTLRIGSAGAEVEDVQRKLASLGYDIGGVVDGLFGPTTRRAVLAFQDENGLKPTGDVDAETKAALEKALKEKAGDAPDVQTKPEPIPAPPPGPPKKPTIEPAPQGPPPLSRSRTIWGAILAGVAGIVGFVQSQSAQLAKLFPVIETPAGSFNTIWVLPALLVLGIITVIYARVDDRSKTGR